MRSEIIIVTAYNEFEYAAKRCLGHQPLPLQTGQPQILLEKVREALEKYHARPHPHPNRCGRPKQAGRKKPKTA